MATLRKILLAAACAMILLPVSSCSIVNKVFGPKYGCPADGKAFGAERILSGEKPPKAKKFRS